MRARNFVSVIAAVGAGVALVSGCGQGGASGSSGDSKVIKIGTLHPMTGSNAGDGAQLQHGAELAVKKINDAGGIKALGGAKLELDAGDTKGTPDTGQSEAQRLVSDGAVALVGSYQSAVSANIAAVAERNKVPFVMDISGDDAILSHGYRYSFRLQPQNSRFGATAAQYIKDITKSKGRPVTKIAYLHEATAFGTGVYTAFKSEAQKLGLAMGPEITYDAASVSDLTTQIAKVKASGANILVVSGYYRDGVLAAKAVQTVKPKLDAVIGAADGAFDQPQFPTDAGSAANGYFDVNYHLNDKSAEAKAFADLYQAAYHDKARASAGFAYDSVRIIAAALERAGSKDPGKIRDAIAKTDLNPLSLSNGPVTFDEKGENTAGLPVLTQIQDGAPSVVYPDNLAAKTIVYPAPVQ
ncbi:ABC transporter substrate-binding protein [Streptomyces brasiliensis]|uniref:Amino acid ABC transporter substrate-binding protein n=1 Tax=Streptomyces brasiliensis TaxID=1954 RepID=A0A917P2S2_9ACTN|nr:ABC transporter substrate-binding protein [Streptomyces brasiliensis]GGJ50060.1 amino acid ABC transporter substrate-binding protein [Streptomyces brasiliensis]